MIKHLQIICLFSTILAADAIYRFPNNHSSFLHDIGSYIKHGENITILAPVFNHSKIKRKIELSAHKGTNVSLLLNNPQGDSLSMIQYNNIELKVVSIKIPYSVIMIDSKVVCMTKNNFDEETLNSSHALVHCTQDEQIINKQLKLIQFISQKSKAYLE